MAKKFRVKKFISTELHNKILIEVQHLLTKRKQLQSGFFDLKFLI